MSQTAEHMPPARKRRRLFFLVIRICLHNRRMLKVLLFQSRKLPEGLAREKTNFERVLGGTAQLDTISAFDESLSHKYSEDVLNKYDGVIFGGSAEYDFDGGRPESDPVRLASLVILSRAKMLMSAALQSDIPVLGICFGHQLIANMFGGNVFNDKAQNKFGTHEVRCTKEGMSDKLFSQMPPTFTAQYAHKDSVSVLPRGATLLAESETCRFSALRYGDKVYTVQFHPEVRRMGDPKAAHDESPEAATLVSKWVRSIVAS